MSNDFEKVLVKDSRMVMSDKIVYTVNKSGQNVTQQTYKAITASTSQVSFNIACPSEQTMVDRKIILRTSFTLEVSGTITNTGNFLILLGTDTALAPFPVQSSLSTCQWTINNNTFSLNQADIVNCILKSNDSRQLNSINSGCPTMPDEYARYVDGLGQINNPLSSYGNSVDTDIIPRGAYYCNSIIDVATGIAPLPSGGNAQGATYRLQFTTDEPLLLSPALLGNEDTNQSAMMGITNMNLVMNFNGGARMLRSAGSKSTGLACKLYSVDSAELHITYITGHPSDIMSPRCCVPYYDLPRYISQVVGPTAGSMSAPTYATISSNSLQLNVIPDKLFIFVRKVLSTQTMTDTDSFMPIVNINVSFNNQSGILSSATDDTLFRLSKHAGINSNWDSWRGRAWQGTNATLGAGVLTAGSMLCLDMGSGIQISEDWFASGSLGNFNLQFNLTVANYSNVDYSPAGNTKLELVLVTMNSGVCAFERGTTSVFTGILTKQDCLDASQMEPYTEGDHRRLVGGAFGDRLKSFGRWLAPKLKEGLSQIDHPYAKAGHEALKSMGYGASGGGMSGGKKSAKSKLEQRLSEGGGFSRG